MNTKVVPFPETVRVAIESLPCAFSTDDSNTARGIARLTEFCRAKMAILGANPLVALAVESVVANCRGGKSGRIIVDDNGDFAVEVTCATGRKVEEPAVEPAKPQETVPEPTTRGPSLDDLRVVAAILGVDISDLGRKKGLIIARLDAARAARAARPTSGDESAINADDCDDLRINVADNGLLLI
jgi:hypothetical protein